MSEAAVIPEQNVVTATPPDAEFQKIFSTSENFQDLNSGNQQQKEQKIDPNSKEALKADASNEQSKEQKKEQKQEEPKEKKGGKRWEALEEVKKTEAKEEAKDAETQSTDEAPPSGKDGQTRWMQLKTAEKELKDLRPKFEELTKKLESIEVNGAIPEDVQKKLDRFEQMFAEQELENQPEFQNEVLVPIHRAFTDLGDIAKGANLDPMQGQALLEAIRNTSQIERARAIRKIISSGNAGMEDGEPVALPDQEISDMVSAAIGIARELHDKHWPKEVAYRGKAREIAQAHKESSTHETVKQKAEREKAYTEEASKLADTVKERLPLVFDQHPDAYEAIKNAKPSTELADQVFDAQAGHLVNFMAKTINSLNREIGELKAREKARQQASPGNKSSANAQDKKQESQQPSFEEVFGHGR